MQLETQLYIGDKMINEMTQPTFLNDAYEKLSGKKNVFDVMIDFDKNLKNHNTETNEEGWKDFCKSVCRNHPVTDLIHQAPFTRRAFEKPRGYPGDAIILDYIYQELIYDEDETPLSHQLYDWEMQTQSCRSVRARRDILTNYIDETAERKTNAQILSVACGHLREAQKSNAVRKKKLGRFLALDQDEKSLEVIAKEQSNFGVETINGSIRALLTKNLTFKNLDFVYAAGLYDYLTLPIAKHLTKIMFEMLQKEGKLLVANFSPVLENRCYLEAFMDWWLIYRTDQEVREFAGSIDPDKIKSMRTFLDSAGSIIFLEIEKR